MTKKVHLTKVFKMMGCSSSLENFNLKEQKQMTSNNKAVLKNNNNIHRENKMYKRA